MVNLLQIRAAAGKYVRQIEEHAKQDKVRMGVLVILLPLDAPETQAQYAGNIKADLALRVLDEVRQAVAVDRMTLSPGGPKV